MTEFSRELTRLAREESGRVLALLAVRFGVDLADDAVQEALIEALDWTVVPDNPAAWLYTVARNRAIDRIRRRAAAQRRERSVAVDLAVTEPHAYELHDQEEVELIVDDDRVGDERLRLMLLCCHPALSTEAQVALTLRLVGGLTTAEIAAAFLLPEATLAQRIVRAKRKIRDAGIPLSLPSSLAERVDALRSILYLTFNEGYLARAGGNGARIDLMAEATRLTAMLLREHPRDPETEGLLALELFTQARNDARFASDEIVLMEDQDRTRWDLSLIEQGNRVLRAAASRNQPGPYQLQAAVAACHANAREFADTDWSMIVSLYRRLQSMTPSPVISVNLAVAIGMADGPQAGLVALDEIAALDGYHLYWSTRGELLLRAGRVDAAGDALGRARALAANPTEQRHLDRRIAHAAGRR
ncbi:RNA polymerase sigma factor [Microbacterium sp. SLBN-146]|uniref:RNA polymerase sigma factor n=1 Tax=Microbacterium sp. SLBN-146 TaxID=2768457 RepID=UPI001173DB85|nr:sigma-70 family RNA polymerase sigma factor [Microbacterium sp. SLBN-146]TQJ32152.1 RNA polymerase sigma-70 factor (ECF subfamily) [Microbacterium sp. SLBN-146]